MTLLSCWKCHRTLQNVILPMSRREECMHCQADQHVCLMCHHYDVLKKCTEDSAEEVNNIEKVNFCDYFKLHKQNTKQQSTHKAETAKAKLAALFGDPPPIIEKIDHNLSAKERAEKKLRELLGGDS